jgi:hypothetical protein
MRRPTVPSIPVLLVFPVLITKQSLLTLAAEVDASDWPAELTLVLARKMLVQKISQSILQEPYLQH